MSGFRLFCRKSQVEQCATKRWYDLFTGRISEEGQQLRRKCTIRTEFIELSEGFIAYLNSDGIILPEHPGDHVVPLLPCDPRSSAANSNGDDQSIDGEPGWGEEEEEEGEEEQMGKCCFPELERAIFDKIQALGGQVFVKLDWSSPQDAAWVFGTLKCTNPGEVFLLLKSSDFIQFDLNHAFERVQDSKDGSASTSATLTLRKWTNLNPAMEFRCFVYNRQLKCICQRDARQFFEFLNADEMRQTIKDKICSFFDTYVKRRYPGEIYTMDVYIDRSNVVWLIDFGVLCEFADEESKFECDHSKELYDTPPHELLSWEELHELTKTDTSDEKCILRIITSKAEASRTKSVLGAHRVPIELVTGELDHEEFDKVREIFGQQPKSQ